MLLLLKGCVSWAHHLVRVSLSRASKCRPAGGAVCSSRRLLNDAVAKRARDLLGYIGRRVRVWSWPR